MNDSIKTKLLQEQDTCDWTMLHPHYVRDAVFLVDQSVNLVDACTAVATNDSATIEKLINGKLIFRPDGLQVEQWHKQKPTFKCIIVSPYVFIQL